MVGHIFDDLKEYRIEYDVKTSEKALSEKYDLKRSSEYFK